MAAVTQNALPNVPTRFVGRDAEIRQIERAFADGARLVTITGPPGIGKTRLALRYAESLSLDARSGGVWFVDLSAAQSLEALCSSVASELGVVSGRDGGLVARVGHALEARGDTLLVLDNFEQLLATDAPVQAMAAWLASTRGAAFLVTSREVLRMRGELVIELAPLSVPEGPSVTREQALRSSAVALLLERAPNLPLTDENAPLFTEIVSALDGIPLALELCAPRLLALGPKAVLERMPARLDLLGRGERDASARQRTLRSAFDWSWDLLDAAERTALRRASVFERGFDAAAFEHVCGEGSARALDTLQSLREKSLVRALSLPGSADLRFGLYESTRAYAAEHLAESGEMAGVELEHARFFAREGYARAARVHGERGSECLAWLSRELSNLLVAAERLHTEASPEHVALRAELLVASEPVFALRGPSERFEQLLDELCASRVLADIEPERAARALRARAYSLRQRGQLAEAMQALEMAAACAQRAEHPALISELYTEAGEIEQERGRFGEAGARYEKAIAALAELDAPRARARALGGFGILHHSQGRLEEARAAYERALQYAERARDRRLEAAFIKDLGSVRLQQGRLDEARDLYHRARALLEELADPVLVGAVEGNLAILAQEQGDTAHARELFESAHGRLGRHGARLLAAHVAGYFGGLLHELNEIDQAASYYERSIGVLREFGDVRNVGLFTALLGAAQAARGRGPAAEEAFAAAERALVEVGDPGLLEALELNRAHLTLLSARALDASAAQAARTSVIELAQESRERKSRAAPELSDDARLSLRLLEAALGREAWLFDFEHAELRPPGLPAIELKKRPQLLRIVRALVEARLSGPGLALTQEQLLEAGWPGERMQPAAAANRVKVALSTLRSAGLRDLLLRAESGHLLDPNVPIVAPGLDQSSPDAARKRR